MVRGAGLGWVYVYAYKLQLDNVLRMVARVAGGSGKFSRRCGLGAAFVSANHVARARVQNRTARPTTITITITVHLEYCSVATMETILPPALPWSTRLTFSAAPATLTGDKILLPSSALEQLLSAATTAAATTEASHDPESWAAPPTHRSEREHLLPQPMIVRLSTGSGEKRRSVHAVPREFSAEEGEVVVSGYLAEALGLSSVEMAGKVVDVEAATLPKGTRLRLRPLEAGYEEEDWKAILEAFVRKEGFATLEEGVILSVPRGVGSKGSWRFLVDEAVPGGSVCLIDTG